MAKFFNSAKVQLKEQVIFVLRIIQADHLCLTYQFGFVEYQCPQEVVEHVR